MHFQNQVLFFIITSKLYCSLGCSPYFPNYKTKFYGGFGHFRESKRNKVLDCECGTLKSTAGASKSSSFHFPWNVLIAHTKSNHARDVQSSGKFCSGTIINDRVILTTTSCVLKVSIAHLMEDVAQATIFPEKCIITPENVRVWITADISSTPKTSNQPKGLEIADINYHPFFLYHQSVYANKDYDIALLKLKNPLNFKTTSATPVCLPVSYEDEELEGIETWSTRWVVNETVLFLNQTADALQEEMLSNMINNRKRCCMNTETSLIPNRFLCTEATELSMKHHYVDTGGALLGKRGNQYVQYGVTSWKSYFPLLSNKKPVSLSTNVGGFLSKIETYSQKVNARWCLKDWDGGRPTVNTNYKPSRINEPLQMTNPWTNLTSEHRSVWKKCGLANSQVQVGRIQGGEPAKPYEYGWQVQLIGKFKKDGQICGGTIVNDRVVVTAAHCVFKLGDSTPDKQITPENMQVRVWRHKGATQWDSHSRVVKVKTIIPHPNFKIQPYLDYDIALIILRKRIDFHNLQGKVSPICFPETGEVLQTDNREDGMVLGWGRTHVLKKGSLASELQQLNVNVISHSNCQNLLSRLGMDFMFLRDRRKICAGNNKNVAEYKDPAQGDSGGPLFIPLQPGSRTMMHIGIASMITLPLQVENPHTAKLSTVVLYTNSTAFIDFLDYYSLIADARWCSR